MVRLSLITLAAVAVSTGAARRCPGAFINCRYASDAVCTAGCSHIFWGCGCSETRQDSALVDSACTNYFGTFHGDC
ncbi:hypothetical protein C8035_v012183 [Colletotrichum spinosum]|uniref:Secreted protein n=1 Tax=Colletotrichum spinosum TaxID=1347390 RepID=A0A4V6QEE9_9PEZI|nr:hypothetical protein C8035_v012183 [Colletotrichum spinosum]